MRGAPLLVVTLVLSGALVFAQAGLSTYEQLTVGATATAIATTTMTPTGRSQLTRCRIQAEHTVRWRDDGTNPTATAGALLTLTDDPLIVSNEIARSLRFISTSASNATVNVSCSP